MKHYRIIRKTEKYINIISGYRNKAEVREKIWYVAKQRFLWIFWLKVGHESDDFFGFTVEYMTSTRQEMEEYLQAWHEVHYGKEEYKIDYKV